MKFQIEINDTIYSVQYNKDYSIHQAKIDFNQMLDHILIQNNNNTDRQILLQTHVDRGYYIVYKFNYHYIVEYIDYRQDKECYCKSFDSLQNATDYVQNHQ